jgi:hypothetical protein
VSPASRAAASVPLPPSPHIPTDLPPAIVGLLWRRGVLAENDVIATIVDLIRRGALEIDLVPRHSAPRAPAQVPAESIFDVQTHRLTLRDDATDELAPFEAELVRVLFSQLQKGPRITADQYRSGFRRDFDWFQVWFREWRHLVYRDPRSKGLIDVDGMARADKRKGLLFQSGTLGLVGEVLLCAFILPILLLALALLHGAALIIALVTAVVLVVAVTASVVRALTRPPAQTLTPLGRRLLEQYTALRDYLRDVSRMQDMPPEAVVVWDQYLALAVVFGLGDRIVGDFFVASPNAMQRCGIEWTSATIGVEDCDEGDTGGKAASRAQDRYSREYYRDLRLRREELAGPVKQPPGPGKGTL